MSALARILGTWFGRGIRAEGAGNGRIAGRAGSSPGGCIRTYGVPGAGFAVYGVAVACAGDLGGGACGRRQRQERSADRRGRRSGRPVDHARRRDHAQLEELAGRVSAVPRCSTSGSRRRCGRLERFRAARALCSTTSWRESTARLCCSPLDGSIFISGSHMALRKNSESRPQISEVSPAAAIPGGEFQIRGKGLAGAGAAHGALRRGRRARRHRLGFLA